MSVKIMQSTTQSQLNIKCIQSVQPTEHIVYTLQQFNDVSFKGFEFALPEETLNIITKMASEVGSPTYIKTPVFHVRNNLTNSSTNSSNNSSVSSSSSGSKKKYNNHAQSSASSEDWESLRTFHVTTIEKKTGIDGVFDKIRMQLNKITDKNYVESKTNIINLLDELVEENEDLLKIANALFDIASNNRFYSKLYAELYSELIAKYEPMRSAFQTSYQSFVELFDNVECGDPDKNYDEFCRINKVNECRKALSLFFVNLSDNGVLTKLQILSTLHKLFTQMCAKVCVANNLNEVNELVEVIAILYSKELMNSNQDHINSDEFKIDGKTIQETISAFATSKPKTFPSLSSKAKFKFMDIIDA